MSLYRSIKEPHEVTISFMQSCARQKKGTPCNLILKNPSSLSSTQLHKLILNSSIWGRVMAMQKPSGRMHTFLFLWKGLWKIEDQEWDSINCSQVSPGNNNDSIQLERCLRFKAMCSATRLDSLLDKGKFSLVKNK